MQDQLYNRMPLYAKLQAQAEHPRTVARMQEGLQDPAYQDLADRVGQPSYQTRLQSELYGSANRYVGMERQVMDPSYVTDQQTALYGIFFRPGPEHVVVQSQQAIASETLPQPGRLTRRQPRSMLPPHVP